MGATVKVRDCKHVGRRGSWRPGGRLILLSLRIVPVLLAGLAFAHEQPNDPVADFVLADWMLLTSFFGFVLPALLITGIAWKRGLFRDIEGEVKTFWLTPEPDYETPPWAWEEPPEWAKEVNDGGTDR